MRTLTTKEAAEQKKMSYDGLCKIVLTKSGEDTQTYTITRIIDIRHDDGIWSQKAKVLLDDSDGVLTALDLKAYQGVISYGFTTADGDEYSACAPLWVKAQSFASIEDSLRSELSLQGVFDEMAEDEASADYKPDSDDTKTVKTLLTEIAEATMTCFSHCTAYTITFDTEDSLIDVFAPKDGFRVYVGDSRLTKFRWLLALTGCSARIEDDGEIHVFVPTVSGTTYNSEYSLADGEHTFFKKSYRDSLIAKNYVVVKSMPDDDPQYSGYAEESQDITHRTYRRLRLASDAQATAIAEAILANEKMWNDMGSARVPMNIGAEVLDYIKVTDTRQGDERTGNVGFIHRHVNVEKNIFEMNFGFGDISMQRAKQILADIKTYTEEGAYFNRLVVGDLVVENITAGDILLYTMDDISDGDTYARLLATHISAGKIQLLDATVVDAGFTVDKVNDGTTYGRVKQTNISAGNIELIDATIVDAGFTLDKIHDGVTNGKVLLTSLSAGSIKLSSNTVVDGEWYDESGVEIDATHGINLYGTENALTTRATKAGTIQCYVGSDGNIKAGAGTVLLNASGLTIKGEKIFLQHTDATGLATFATAASLLQLKSSSGVGIQIICQGEGALNLDGGGIVSITSGTGDDLDLYAGADIMVDATDGFSLRAGGTAPTAPGTGDVHIDADDLCQIRAGLGETGNLTLTAGVENSYLGNIYLRAYDNGGGYSGIDMAGSGDIEIDPEGNDVLPGSSGTTDLGTESTYWDAIECVTLDDSHSPAPFIDNPLAALRAMRETTRTLTIDDVLNEHLGKRLKRMVEEAGGTLTIRWKDKESFPEEILHRPRPEAFEKAKKFNAKKRKQFKERGHTPPHFRDVFPVTSTDVFAEIWMIIRANQQLADEVDLLRDRIAVLEAG